VRHVTPDGTGEASFEELSRQPPISLSATPTAPDVTSRMSPVWVVSAEALDFASAAEGRSTTPSVPILNRAGAASGEAGAAAVHR
jgi:hypothetical protein